MRVIDMLAGFNGRAHEIICSWDRSVHSEGICSAVPRQVRVASAWSIREQIGHSGPEQSCLCSATMRRQEKSMSVSNIMHRNPVAKR